MTGADFRPAPATGDPLHGCLIAQPVILLSLGKGIGLEPEALLDCPTAVRFAGFMQTSAQSAAKANLGSGIAEVHHASAYVCRPRNGASKLSEHAFGRGIDIASFTLPSGLTVPVMALPKDRELEATFLATIRAAACGPFTTVLGPGSNADHATHFHFDLAPRKGRPVCE